MIEALVIVVVLLVVIPVGFLMTMGLVAGGLGWLIGSEVEAGLADDDDQLLLARNGHSLRPSE